MTYKDTLPKYLIGGGDVLKHSFEGVNWVADSTVCEMEFHEYLGRRELVHKISVTLLICDVFQWIFSALMSLQWTVVLLWINRARDGTVMMCTTQSLDILLLAGFLRVNKMNMGN